MPMQWRMLVVEDDETIAGQIMQRAGSGKLLPEVGAILCEHELRFPEACAKFESSRYDFVVLDIRGPHGEDDQEVGVTVFEQIKRLAFVPIVFYTAVPNAVREIETAFVRVVEKTRGLPGLTMEMRALYKTGLPEFRRHLDEEQRRYLWEFVSERWSTSGLAADDGAVAYLLARRLSRVLAQQSIRRFLSRTTTGDASLDDDATVLPVETYILPPLGETCLAGDVMRGRVDGSDGYWVVLTPSCDLEHGKAERVLLAKCRVLAEERECAVYRKAIADGKVPSNTVTDALKALLGDNRKKHQAERFKFLPGVFDLPDLLVDFQALVQLPSADFDQLERVASLDTPFAEALVARFARYYGRIGTPDLNTNAVLARLKASWTAPADG